MSKTAAEIEAGKYTEKNANDDGWQIAHQQEPRSVVTQAPNLGRAEVLVEDGKFIAEKTQDDHLITAVGRTMDELLENIRQQQASIDNGISRDVATTRVENDQAGNDNEGIGSVLPELVPHLPEEDQS